MAIILSGHNTNIVIGPWTSPPSSAGIILCQPDHWVVDISLNFSCRFCKVKLSNRTRLSVDSDKPWTLYKEAYKGTNIVIFSSKQFLCINDVVSAFIY